MITEQVKVENQHGIHMRVASRIVEIARENNCRIELYKDGVKADASSILELLILEATRNSTLTVVAMGENEGKSVNEIRLLLIDGAGI